MFYNFYKDIKNIFTARLQLQSNKQLSSLAKNDSIKTTKVIKPTRKQNISNEFTLKTDQKSSYISATMSEQLQKFPQITPVVLFVVNERKGLINHTYKLIEGGN